MKQDNTDFSRFTLTQASHDHCQDICDLINLTYRGDSGWTRETHIISGDRTNLDEITLAMAKPNAQFYVVYLEQQLATCVYLAQEQHQAAYIGYFSVHPDFQGQGIGKHILQQAEAIAKKQFSALKIRMYVVSQRPELIAFYQRRGYQRVGSQTPYPLELKIGVPKVPGLTIEYLEKSLS